MATNEYEKHLQKMMKTLGITREEAIELDEYDDEINHNKPTQYDLTPEQMEVARKMTRVEQNAKHRNTKRDRKPNYPKETLIKELADFLREDAQSNVFENVTIENKSRLITFDINDTHYTLNLIEHRKPKP